MIESSLIEANGRVNRREAPFQDIAINNEELIPNLKAKHPKTFQTIKINRG